MGKLIIVCVGFSAAGQKFTKRAEAVTGNTFIFFGEIHSISACLIFWSNLVRIGHQYLLIMNYKIVLFYKDKCDLDPRFTCSFSAMFCIVCVAYVRFTEHSI